MIYKDNNKNSLFDIDKFSPTYKLRSNADGWFRLYLDQRTEPAEFSVVNENSEVDVIQDNIEELKVFPIEIHPIRLKKMDYPELNNPYECWSLDYKRPSIESAALWSDCYKCEFFSTMEYPYNDYKFHCKKSYLVFMLTVDTREKIYMFLDGEKRKTVAAFEEHIRNGSIPLLLSSTIVDAGSYRFSSLTANPFGLFPSLADIEEIEQIKR